ncbi:MAG: hypothetical protein HQL73_05060 [Magnetococcales bacterium]|nr:hypothetical protein [Magnetococcales bacterium]
MEPAPNPVPEEKSSAPVMVAPIAFHGRRHFLGMHLTMALVVLVLGCWASSGTLAPYAATHYLPQVLPCNYLGNPDHWHFWQPYLLFQDVPSHYWQQAIKLRRILHPMLSWPLVASFGFLLGGFIANVLMTGIASAVFLRFIHLRHGPRATIVTAWLLATYPGIAYWVGLPYSYASAVPSMLLAAVLMHPMIEQQGRPISFFLRASGIGILFLAYDGLLLILFPAVAWMTVRNKTWPHLPLVFVGLFWPSVGNTWFMTHILQADLVNSNSVTYYFILESYLHGPWSWDILMGHMRELPLLGAKMLFFGNFFFLPLTFLFFILLNRRTRAHGLRPVEEALLVAALGLLVFLNIAPPYPGWQMRGEWVARLFQPIFVAFLLVIARGMARSITLTPSGNLLRITLVSATILAQGWVVFGGLHKSRVTDMVYRNFLTHPHHAYYLYNLEKYGVRPLGFCQETESPPS